MFGSIVRFFAIHLPRKIFNKGVDTCIDINNKISKTSKNVIENINLMNTKISNKIKNIKEQLIIQTINNTNKNIMSKLLSLFIEDEKFVEYYHILDNNNNVKYIGKYDYITEKNSNNTIPNKVYLYNTKNQLLGSVRNQVNIANNEAKKVYSIYYKKDRILDISKDLNTKNITYAFYNKKFKLEKLSNYYSLKEYNHEVLKFNTFEGKNDGTYTEQYVLEYSSKDCIGLLLIMGIDLINKC